MNTRPLAPTPAATPRRWLLLVELLIVAALRHLMLVFFLLVVTCALDKHHTQCHETLRNTPRSLA
jgi:hypothetical protein